MDGTLYYKVCPLSAFIYAIGKNVEQDKDNNL